MNRFITALIFIVSSIVSLSPALAGEEIIGKYDVDRAKQIKPLTFPRIMLYDSAGKLIDHDSWPIEIKRISDLSSDAFCCISDGPKTNSNSDGPPENCKKIIYGEHLNEHFEGLKTLEGSAISIGELPAHKYLIVDYYAEWCGPCHASRKAMDDFIKSSASKEYVSLIIDFTNLSY